ncbi:hypothetical protein PILCRDRAFT_99351 [Piloderma croceum F 1598]|uniref:Uncharacterized protein n=1 Tax=Piloderma croceum (strain F 1598) TaxID=765440 RepID=A0A0C3AGS6_PILCF|nr:hypothetical protein PILCRDRAFT_99351 [Piloderma croceum F 1598]
MPTPSEVYRCLLLPTGNGFPLWTPEPNEMLPDEKRDKGIMIGDVGIIKADGSFDFLFNICVSSSDPINRDRVPPEFENVASESHIPVTIGGGFSFTCSSTEGAVLTLPEGASRVDLDEMATLRDQAFKHGQAWYQYARLERGREFDNGAFYLITGCDQAKCWGIASVSNISGACAVSLMFTAAQLSG